jgi:glutamyl-tRNA synthetase
VNGEWIRRLTLNELLERIEPFVRERFGTVEATTLRSATAVGQPRAVTLVALVEQMGFLFEPDEAFSIAPDAWDKVVATERVAELFDAVIDFIAGCEWSDEINVLDTVKALDLKPRKAMPALYAAVEGRAAGLPLFDSIALLGRERSLGRLRGARQRLT